MRISDWSSDVCSSDLLDELAAQDFVERKRRVGTTVAFRSPAKPFQGDIDQAVESLLNFGRSTKVKLLEMERVPARAPHDEALRVEGGTPLLRVVRVRTFDRHPVGHFVSYIPVDIAGHMTRANLQTTPMLALNERAGVRT